MVKEKKVSILIVTYNAQRFIKRTLDTLKKTNYPNYEVIVVDNDSNEKTKNYLKEAKNRKLIDKLILLNKNQMWIKGNNIAFENIDKSSEYLILLNSDIEIRNSNWIYDLLSIHKKGIIGCGITDKIDFRPDSWCFLIDRDLYSKYKLDENFKVNYAAAALTHRVLKDDYNVITIKNYENFIYHFGGSSGGFPKSDDYLLFEKYKTEKKCTVIENIQCNSSFKIKTSIIFNLYVKLNKIKRKLIKKFKGVNK